MMIVLKRVKKHRKLRITDPIRTEIRERLKFGPPMGDDIDEPEQ